LVQAQAILVKSQAEYQAQKALLDREVAEMKREQIEVERRLEERFRRIDGALPGSMSAFARIEAILVEHHRLLEALPDVIRDKIGFKIPPSS
jgi:hypothetical protein